MRGQPGGPLAQLKNLLQSLEKLEIVKFERERIALKEEQFIRLLHKVETE